MSRRAARARRRAEARLLHVEHERLRAGRTARRSTSRARTEPAGFAGGACSKRSADSPRAALRRLRCASADIRTGTPARGRERASRSRGAASRFRFGNRIHRDDAAARSTHLTSWPGDVASCPPSCWASTTSRRTQAVVAALDRGAARGARAADRSRVPPPSPASAARRATAARPAIASVSDLSRGYARGLLHEDLDLLRDERRIVRNVILVAEHDLRV